MGVTVSEFENETARPHSYPRNHVSNGASHSVCAYIHARVCARRKGRLCAVWLSVPCCAIVEKPATWIVVDATAALDVVARATVHDNTPHATCGVTQAVALHVDRHCGKRFGAAVRCGYCCNSALMHTRSMLPRARGPAAPGRSARCSCTTTCCILCCCMLHAAYSMLHLISVRWVIVRLCCAGPKCTLKLRCRASPRVGSCSTT